MGMAGTYFFQWQEFLTILTGNTYLKVEVLQAICYIVSWKLFIQPGLLPSGKMRLHDRLHSQAGWVGNQVDHEGSFV